jgi:anti-anti-sigma regulatory factor
MNDTLKFREEEDDVVVIDIGGELTREVNSLALRALLTELKYAGYEKICLNLGGLTRLDRVAARDLILAARAFVRAGGALRLFSVPECAASVLLTVSPNSVLKFYENEREAILSFCAPRPAASFRIPQEMTPLRTA